MWHEPPAGIPATVMRSGLDAVLAVRRRGVQDWPWIRMLSVFVCVLIIAGVLNRGRKRVHIPLMVSALAIDLAMVLFLEITRGVVESIPGRQLSPKLVIHILLSLTVLALYTVQVVTGIKKARGGASGTHRKMLIWLLVTRLGNLITSFLIV